KRSRSSWFVVAGSWFVVWGPRTTNHCPQTERLLRLDVNPAFQLLPLPAAGARIVRVERRRRTRLAPDTGVAHLVQREQLNAVLLGVGPHVLHRPGRQRAHTLDHLSTREPERLD